MSDTERMPALAEFRTLPLERKIWGVAYAGEDTTAGEFIVVAPSHAALCRLISALNLSLETHNAFKPVQITVGVLPPEPVIEV